MTKNGYVWVVVLVPVLFLSARAHAHPRGFFIPGVSFSGNCDRVHVLIPSATQFDINLGTGFSAQSHNVATSRSCDIALKLVVPKGWRMTFGAHDPELGRWVAGNAFGQATNPPGIGGSHSVTWWLDVPQAEQVTNSIPLSAVSDNYSFSLFSEAPPTNWTPCGGPGGGRVAFRVNARISLPAVGDAGSSHVAGNGYTFSPIWEKCD